MKQLIFWVSFALLILSTNSRAGEVAVPLKLEHRFIEQIILDQIFTSKNKSFSVLNDKTGCNKLVLTNPKVDNYNGLLRVRVNAKSRFGQLFGEQCLVLLEWQGKLDLLNKVKLAKNGRSIIINTVDSQLLDNSGKVDETTNQLWQVVQKNVYPMMDKIVIDLEEPLNNIKAFVPDFLGNQEKVTVNHLINSFAINNISANPKGVLLNLKFDIPEKAPPAKQKVPKLSKQELTILEGKLNALDAFMSVSIKSFLTPQVPATLRMQLLDTLIDLRYEIAHLLDQPDTSGPDPVKKLFLDTWLQIAPIVRDISRLYGDQAMSLHYMTFIAANDVLYTIEQISPGLGMDVSIDGLRRLARELNADSSIDPLKLEDEKIPTFRLNDDSITKEFLPPVTKTNSNWLDFFVQDAIASVKPNKKVIEKLNNWVPKKKDMNEYLPMVQQVLSHAIEAEINKSKLDKKYHKLYRSLVYATAWQESCWRQYQVVKKQRWPLKSYSGDLGMMQINPRVWRGFYSIHKIKWDITYNAKAGAEIAMYYLQRYAIKNKEHIKTGKLENLARASYSGYNGGPRQITRYRDKSAPKLLKRIDTAFYKKFKEVHSGDAMAVRSCYPGI